MVNNLKPQPSGKKAILPKCSKCQKQFRKKDLWEVNNKEYCHSCFWIEIDVIPIK